MKRYKRNKCCNFTCPVCSKRLEPFAEILEISDFIAYHRIRLKQAKAEKLALQLELLRMIASEELGY
jgi:hypothetical protein